MKLSLYNIIVVLVLLSILGCTPVSEPIITEKQEIAIEPGTQTKQSESDFSIINNTKPIDSNYKAKGTLLDLETNTTHLFSIQRDNDLIIADFIFNIDNKQYPGSIIYKANESYLFRKSPNQAVRFEKDAVIFGFLHPGAVNREDIEVLRKDEQGYALEYIIEGKTKVNLDSLNFVPIVLDFNFPVDTRFFNQHEELYNIV